MRSSLWLPAAFVASFLAVGATHWFLPYREIELPDSLYGPSLWVAGAAALGAAVLARGIYDTENDPTSHNLLGIELMIAAVVGVGVSACGASIGWAARRLLRRNGRVSDSPSGA